MWTSRKVSRWENVSQYLRLLLKGKNVQEQNLKVAISCLQEEMRWVAEMVWLP